jgi:hypothetical protein
VVNEDGEHAAWRAIVAAALRAPWADNRPALRFEWREGALEWLLTDTGEAADLPHRRWLAHVACGAALENARLRAASLGLRLEHAVTPDPARPALVARSRIGTPHDAAAMDLMLAAQIERRCTNRRFYRREPLAPATEAAIAGAAGVSWHWLDGGARQRALAALRLAEAERFRRPRLHQELFEAIRFDVGWSATAMQGLPPGALEIERLLRRPFAALRHPRLMRVLAVLGVPAALGLRAADLPCRLAPRLAMIGGEAAQNGDGAGRVALAAGRALQRGWLAATAHGVALQPFAAVGALLRQRAAAGWVSTDTQQRLRELLAETSSAGGPHAVHLFVRLGHAKPPTMVTGRASVDSVLPEALCTTQE